jgi:hypothetical protein
MNQEKEIIMAHQGANGLLNTPSYFNLKSKPAYIWPVFTIIELILTNYRTKRNNE